MVMVVVMVVVMVMVKMKTTMLFNKAAQTAHINRVRCFVYI